MASLDEALEETLTLHGLGLFPMLGGEPEDHQLCGIPECVARPAHRQGGSLTHVGPKTALSDQWLSLIEPRLRQIRCHRHLPQLRAALQVKTGKAERVEGTCIA